jgi:hypothetical protein
LAERKAKKTDMGQDAYQATARQAKKLSEESGSDAGEVGEDR